MMAVLTGAAAYFKMLTGRTPFDDEGTLMLTVQETLAGKKLYQEVLSIYGPLYLLSFASLLVIAYPLRHVLQDGGVWTGPSSEAFKDGCGEGWRCLTPRFPASERW